MSEGNLTGPINLYGDLSRRARRELEARGINPEDALAQYRETGDIQALTGSIPLIRIETEPALPVRSVDPAVPLVQIVPTAPAAPPVPPTAPAVPSIFPSSLSRRDESIIEQRLTAETEIVTPTEDASASKPEDVAPSVESLAAEISTSQDMDELIAIVERDTNVVPDPTLASSQDVEPVVFDGGLLADVDEVIAIDRADDTEATISEYEAFQVTTTSTGIIPTTGHTLILPTLPEEDPTVIAALNETGEIVITGQISLPAMPNATAPTASVIDSSDLDQQNEPELVTSSNDLAPVSAAQAVSSSAGPTTSVSPVRRRSERLPLILAISAAVLALGVVGLFVANLFIPVFK